MHIPVFKSHPEEQSSAATTHIPFVQVDVLLPEHWFVPGAHSWHLESMQCTEAQSECARQALPIAQGEQNPPQSTSDSSPFCTPSAQLGIAPSDEPGISIAPTSLVAALSVRPPSLVGVDAGEVSELQAERNARVREIRARERIVETCLPTSLA
jgi:hypothetical protein